MKKNEKQGCELENEGEEMLKRGGAASKMDDFVAKTGAEAVKMDALKSKVEELTADLQRTRADFENFRKQVDAQKEIAKKTAKYTTVMKILPALDDMERAVASYAELKPLEKTLAKTLKELGLEKIASRAGQEFNPDEQDAVMVEGDGEKEVIEATLRAGYRYEGEVVRPAMVKIKKT